MQMMAANLVLLFFFPLLKVVQQKEMNWFQGHNGMHPPL